MVKSYGKSVKRYKYKVISKNATVKKTSRSNGNPSNKLSDKLSNKLSNKLNGRKKQMNNDANRQIGEQIGGQIGGNILDSFSSNPKRVCSYIAANIQMPQTNNQLKQDHIDKLRKFYKYVIYKMYKKFKDIKQYKNINLNGFTIRPFFHKYTMTKSGNTYIPSTQNSMFNDFITIVKEYFYNLNKQSSERSLPYPNPNYGNTNNLDSLDSLLLNLKQFNQIPSSLQVYKYFANGEYSFIITDNANTMIVKNNLPNIFNPSFNKFNVEYKKLKQNVQTYVDGLFYFIMFRRVSPGMRI